LFCGLNINEFTGDSQIPLKRVAAQKLQLSGDRKTFFFLVFGGDAGIKDAVGHLWQA
jgi:hypothetical protein